jgi:hypothetical protein
MTDTPLIDASAVYDANHLSPEAAKVLDAPRDVRAAFVARDLLVRYPAFDAMVERARALALAPVRTRAQGLVLSAKSNNGKTTLANSIHSALSKISDANRPIALSIDVGGATDGKTIYGRILDAPGSPARISHRLNDRELILTHILKTQRVRLLILDELQDITTGNERDRQRVLMCIRYLMNNMQLQVLGLGTETAFQTLSANSHLAARFREVSLPKWRADATLARFLATFERYLPLPAPSNLSSPGTLKLLAKVGQGSIGTIIDRLRDAAHWAIAEDLPSITPDLLERAILPPAECLYSEAL